LIFGGIECQFALHLYLAKEKPFVDRKEFIEAFENAFQNLVLRFQNKFLI
jgi:hypothetical protein